MYFRTNALAPPWRRTWKLLYLTVYPKTPEMSRYFCITDGIIVESLRIAMGGFDLGVDKKRWLL